MLHLRIYVPSHNLCLPPYADRVPGLGLGRAPGIRATTILDRVLALDLDRALNRARLDLGRALDLALGRDPDLEKDPPRAAKAEKKAARKTGLGVDPGPGRDHLDPLGRRRPRSKGEQLFSDDRV